MPASTRPGGQVEHWAVYTANNSDKSQFITRLMEGILPPAFEALAGLRPALFSKMELDRYIEEEERHDQKILTAGISQSLRSMSGGERKKALFRFLLQSKPGYLILDNPFDNLDVQSQKNFKSQMEAQAATLPIVQMLSREADLLPFIGRHARLRKDGLCILEAGQVFRDPGPGELFKGSIPPALQIREYEHPFLVEMHNVSVNYGEKQVLREISWSIKPGEFWQLAGKNGSGKTTLLSMITGDNPKGYGQELYLFGRKKGSGESVWDIKKNIGYFTPTMTERFGGHHTLEQMMISGFTDSVGLYLRPGESQRRLAGQWLKLIGMQEGKDSYFYSLSPGQQRLLMCARAMIKHPWLLILDEPTEGLDDASAMLFVQLVNKMAEESSSAIIFVSHREEPGLKPAFLFQLLPERDGSRGKVIPYGRE